jgi:hypothetical protein
LRLRLSLFYYLGKSGDTFAAPHRRKGDGFYFNYLIINI